MVNNNYYYKYIIMNKRLEEGSKDVQFRVTSLRSLKRWEDKF